MASTPQYALSQEWSNLNGATEAKIAQLNAMTVPGPNVDVGISQVAGFLLLQGVFPLIEAFAQGSPNSSEPHDGALTAAKTFMAWIDLQSAPMVHMSDPTVLAQVTAMGEVMVAQETASPGSTGFTQAILNGLLALGQTTMPWWQANGFMAPVTIADVASAGLS